MMKIGEIFDLAKQLYPPLTKRLFTSFYNMALEQISRIIRLNVITKEFTDSTYKSLPAEAVRIESVTTDDLCFWKLVNGELKLYDTDGNEVTDVPDGLSITTWKKITDSISTPDNAGFVGTSQGELIHSDENIERSTGSSTIYVTEDLVAVYPLNKQDSLSADGFLFQWDYTGEGTVTKFMLYIYDQADTTLFYSTPAEGTTSYSWNARTKMGRVRGTNGKMDDGYMTFDRGITYHWKVCAYITTGIGSSAINVIVSSNVWSFTIQAVDTPVTIPESPIALPYVDRGATYFTVGVMAEDNCTETFLIDVSTDNSFDTYTEGGGILYEQYGLPSATNTITIAGLTPATKYYYRFWAQNTEGTSTYPSNTLSCTTLTKQASGSDYFEYFDDSTSATITGILIDRGIYTVADNTTPLVPIGSIVEIIRDPDTFQVFVVSIVDPSDPSVKITVYELDTFMEPLEFGSWTIRPLDELWEEQDNGYANDVQMCAAYTALTMITEFTTGSSEQAQMISQRAAQWLKVLRLKYNASQDYKNFRQVSF